MTIEATWNLSLNCDCPHCKEWVNLLDYADFWDGARFVACEYSTDRTKDVNVICPECGEEFTVDFTY